jgi:hypothetical protein
VNIYFDDDKGHMFALKVEMKAHCRTLPGFSYTAYHSPYAAFLTLNEPNPGAWPSTNVNNAGIMETLSKSRCAVPCTPTAALMLAFVRMCVPQWGRRPMFTLMHPQFGSNNTPDNAYAAPFRGSLGSASLTYAGMTTNNAFTRLNQFNGCVFYLCGASQSVSQSVAIASENVLLTPPKPPNPSLA